jgi:hypothetical protein
VPGGCYFTSWPSVHHDCYVYTYTHPYSFVNCVKRMTVVMPHCHSYNGDL